MLGKVVAVGVVNYMVHRPAQHQPHLTSPEISGSRLLRPKHTLNKWHSASAYIDKYIHYITKCTFNPHPHFHPIPLVTPGKVFVGIRSHRFFFPVDVTGVFLRLTRWQVLMSLLSSSRQGTDLHLVGDFVLSLSLCACA